MISPKRKMIKAELIQRCEDDGDAGTVIIHEDE